MTLPSIHTLGALRFLRSAAVTLAVFGALMLIAPAAFAAPDNVFLGNGHDGGYSAPLGTTVLNSVAPVSGAVSAGASSVTRGTIRSGTVTFTSGRLVLVLQSTGYTGTVVTGDQSAYDLSTGAVGRWEFARISSVSGTTLNFTAPLSNPYASGFSQVVAVPEYTTLMVPSGRTLAGQAWDGSSGGVLAALATGLVTVSGTLNVSSMGFRGGNAVNHGTNTNCTDLDGNLNNAQRGEGIFPAGYGVNQVARGNKTNGGGGANCYNAGGAGGGNGGVGGIGSFDRNGTNNRALGGAPLTYSPYTRALFGGGAGAGEENGGTGSSGGAGGGTVLVRGASMTGGGTVTAAGRTANTAGDDGAGGGGAGGSISLRFTGAVTCSVIVTGGNGGGSSSSSGRPGGGGAGGRALVQGSSTNCSSNVSNGVAGSATSGAQGAGPNNANEAPYSGSITTNATALSAPVSAVTVPAASTLTSDSTPTISGTATANASVDVYVDGTLNGSATVNGSGVWTYDPIFPLTGGAHSTYAIPTYLGIVGAASNTRAFTVDLLPPAAPSITTPSSNAVTGDTTPDLGGTAESNTTVRIYDGATLLGTVTAAVSGVWSFTPPSALSDGAHAITATATDAAGLTGPASAVRTITVDTTPPLVVITFPTEGQVIVGETTSVTFTVTDANPGTFSCAVDGGAFGSCTSPFAASTPTNGSHTVSVRHTDAAGNAATTTRSFVTDEFAPEVSISAPAQGQALKDNTPDITFSASDLHLGAVTCQTDSGSFAACSSPFTTAVLADGAHSVTVRAVDAAGNVGSATRGFTIDTIAPSPPTITAPPADEVVSYSYGRLGGAAEANSTVTGYLLGVSAGSTTADASGQWSFFSSDPRPEGTYSLTVTATDAAGNESAPSTPRVITIDTTTPAVTITAPTPGQQTLDTTPGVAFSVVDSHPGTSACSIDGAPNSPCSSPFSTSVLTNGPHSLTVRHTDQAGNIGSATVAFVVDTISPSVSITAPAQSATLSTRTPSVVFSVADANANTVTCAVDAGAASTCSSPFVTPTLADGLHSVTVSASDAAGNSGSSVRSFTIDGTAPVAPSITTPAANFTTSNNRPSLAGAAEAGSTVTILDGASPIGTVTATAGGAWSFTPSVALTDGAHPITVRATDAAGNQGPASGIRTVTVDTATPAAPAITTPATNVTTSNQTPLLAGTAEANATVTILDGGSTIGTATASAGGAWSFTPSPGLNERAHAITARATDAAGNQSPASSTRTITIDVTLPVIAITAPTAGAALSDSTPNVVFAVSEANPGTTACAVDAGGFAGCSSPFTTPTLTEGPHTVTVRHTDAAGNIATAARSFAVDTLVPAAPVFTFPAGDTITSFAGGTLGGTAEASSVFTLYYLGGPVGTARTSSAGNWQFPSPGLVVDGVYVLSGTATDAAGNESVQSASRTITLDTTTPTVAITAPANGFNTLDTTPDVTFTVSDANPGTTTCAVDSGAYSPCASPFTPAALTEGAHAMRVRHTDLAGNVGSALVSLTVDTVLPVVTISSPSEGAALADNTPDIVFAVSDAQLSTATCATDGGTAATCTSPYTTAPLTDGAHSVTVSASDAAGNSGSATRNFTVDTTTPAAPSITTPAADVTTRNVTPSLVGTAEPNSTVTLRDGGSSIGTTTATPGGTWSFTPVTPLTSGAHTITATATDAAGHTSPASAARTITVDTAAPAAPVITTPAASLVTNVQTPLIAGTAEAGATVSVRDGASPIGSTSAAGGAWSLTPAAPLNEGAHAITATATDAAGNTSPASGVRTITIDITNPGVTITAPAPGAALSDATPDVSFSVADLNLGASTCAVDGGGYSPCSSPFNVPTLTQGAHTVAVRHTDVAGNVGNASRSFTVDTIAPAPPVFTVPAGDTISSSASGSLEGTAEANSTLTLYYLGLPTGVAQTSGAGEWVFPSPGIVDDGVYTLTGTATDAAGNESAQSEPRTITLDATTPTVSITAPLDGAQTLDPTPDVTFTVADANEGTTDCAVDGGALSACSSPYTAPALTDGTHTIVVRHTDLAGNVGSASVSFSVDTISPAVTISSPAEGAVLSDNTPDTVFAVSEAHPSTTTCAIDGGSAASCTSPFTAGELTDAAHSVTVTATDAAGNASSAVRSFTVDTTAPAAPSITTPATDTSTSDTTPSMAGTAEVASTVTILDGASPIGTTTAGIDGAWSFTPGTPLASGVHPLTAVSVDAAGLTSAPSAIRSITIDTAPPSAPLISTPPTDIVTSNQSPPIAGSAEANATVTVLDGASPIGTITADGGGAWTFTPSTPFNESAHSITATATDAAGNTGPASAARTIAVDTTNPSVVISAPPEGSFGNNASPEIVFTVSDLYSGSTECAVDAGTPDACSSPFIASSLADGAHAVVVTHTDLAGNSSSATRNFTVDTSPPAAPTITNPPIDVVVSFSSGMLAGGAEANSTVTGYLSGVQQGSTVADATGHWQFFTAGSRPEGTYVITGRATDRAGNIGPASEARTIVIDQTAPAVSITAPADGAISSNPSVDVAFSVVDANPGTDDCKLDDADFAACTTAFTTSPLEDGGHQLTVRHTDDAGNVGSASVTFTVDATSPVLSVTSPTEGQELADPTPEIVFSVNDGNPGVTTCAVDGEPPVACDSPFPTGPLADGPHFVTLVQTDAAGNSDSVVRSFVIDTAAPAAPTITTPPTDSSTGDNTPTVGGSAEAGSTVTINDGATVLGATTANGGGVWVFTPDVPLTEGTHPIIATATDAAGNSGDISATRMLTVDTGTPNAPVITTPAADVVTADRYAPIAGSAEPNASVTIFDGVSAIDTETANGTGAWSFTPTQPFNEGIHRISATATDAGGNTSVSSATRAITVDITSPQVVITAPVEGSTLNDNTPDVSFVTADTYPASTVCAVDGVTSGACTSPFTPIALPDGPHSVTVLHTDAAGNIGSATVAFIVDTTPPETTITSAPPITSALDDATLVFASSEAGATFECRLDGASWYPCSSPDELTDLPDGTRTFEVRAIDAVGNTDPSPAEHSWTIDSVAPAVPEITSPADPTLTTDPTPTISGTAEAGSTVTLADSGTDLGATTTDTFGAWAFTPPSALSDGLHEVTAMATDAVGNVSLGSDHVSITIDSITPNTTIESFPPSPWNVAISTFSFSASETGATFECRLDSVPWAVCASPASFTGLTDGDHELQVRATDPVGNTDATPAVRSWSIDTVAPAPPTIDSPADAAILDTVTPVMAGAAEPDASVNVFIDELLVGATNADASGAWSLTVTPGLTEGFHDVHALATDPAGNAGARSLAVAFSIDVTPPEGTIERKPGTGLNGDSPTYLLATNDASASIECAIDAAAFTPCNSPYTPGPLGPGTYEFLVRFTDAAGNSTVQSDSFVVPVAAAKPTPEQCPAGMQPSTRTVTVTSAKLRHKTKLTVKVTSPQFVLGQVSLKRGSKRLSKQTLQITGGRTTFTLRGSNLRGARRLTLALGAVVHDRGSINLGSGKLTVSRSGRAKVSPFSGSAGDCFFTSTPPMATVKTVVGPRPGAGSDSVHLVSRSDEYVLSAVSLKQSGETIAKNVSVLSPGKTLDTRIKLSGGRTIRSGTLSVVTTNYSASGAGITFTEKIKVR